MLAEGVLHIFQGEAQLFCFDDELFQLALEEAGAFGGGGWARRGDDGSGADARFEKAFGHKLGDDFVGGVGVDFEFFAEGADGGEWFVGAELPGDDGAFDGIDDLLEEGSAGAQGDPERDHLCVLCGVGRWDCKGCAGESYHRTKGMSTSNPQTSDIDARLQFLLASTESLHQSAQELHASTAANSEPLARVTKNIEELTTATKILAHMAKSHEDRIQDLEGQSGN